MPKQIEGIPIKAGDRVRIPKGSMIWADGQWTEAKRSQVVKVDHLFGGYDTPEGSRPATVVWAGTGEYWKEAKVEDVELINEN